MERKSMTNRLEREQTTIRLPSQLKEDLAKEAYEKGISLNSLILMILEGRRDRRE